MLCVSGSSPEVYLHNGTKNLLLIIVDKPIGDMTRDSLWHRAQIQAEFVRIIARI